MIDYPDRCIPIVDYDTPCQFIFDPIGFWLKLPSYKEPCLVVPALGSIPPDFLTPFDFISKTVALDMYGIPHFTDYWVAPSDPGFQYWTEVDTGIDIALVDGGQILWNFGNPLARPQNKSLFWVPVFPDLCILEVRNSINLDLVPYLGLSKLYNKK